MTVIVTGIPQLEAKLKKMKGYTKLNMEKFVFQTVKETESIAKKEISQGEPRTGVVYKRGGKTAQRSSPGQYPKSDRGALVASINSNVSNNGLYGKAGTNLKYGLYLEFGTVRMGARPWLSPSFRKAIKRQNELLIKRIKRDSKR